MRFKSAKLSNRHLRIAVLDPAAAQFAGMLSHVEFRRFRSHMRSAGIMRLSIYR
jgi:hypothetical protein